MMKILALAAVAAVAHAKNFKVEEQMVREKRSFARPPRVFCVGKDSLCTAPVVRLNFPNPLQNSPHPPSPPARASPQNGAYMFANPTKDSPTTHRGDDYFEVYSPVYTSQYGQVNWDGFSIKLPQEIVDAWENRTMNIVGYEFDAIRKVGGGACVNNITSHSSCEETSLKAYEQYNHHYGNSVSGKGTKMIKDPLPKQPFEIDPVEHMMGFSGYKFVSTEEGELGRPPAGKASSGGLPMGNGAESRFTYHFFPPGYGAQVESPQTTEIRPMFIDITNRKEFGEPLDSNAPERHGPVPKNSNVPPHEMYSGMVRTQPLAPLPVSLVALARPATRCLTHRARHPVVLVAQMECPCTDRYLKTFSTCATQQTGVCMDPKTKASTVMKTSTDCFEGAVSLGMTPSKGNKTVNDPTMPPGCSATAVTGGYEISFNSATSKVTCGAPGNTTHPRAVAQVEDEQVIDFDVDVDMAKDNVTITATGPVGKWFGVGLGAQTMDGVCVGACPPKPGTNAIIFMPDGSVNERELGMHQQGHNIPTSVKVISHTVADGKQTFVVTRNMKGMTANHYTFKGQQNSIDYISALGEGPTFAYHKVKSAGTMFFTEVGSPTCLCSVGYDEGTLGGFAWGGQRCSPPPLGQMIHDPRWNNTKGINGQGNSSNWPSWNDNPIDTANDGINPTCSLKKYRGGLRCCHGNDFIADTDVVLKSQNASTTYFQMKYRYYFEDADVSASKGGIITQNVDTKKDIGWFIEHGNNEDDIPPCDPSQDMVPVDYFPPFARQGLLDEKVCINNITSNATGTEFAGAAPNGTEIQMIHVEGHCHIGCLSMQLWNMSATPPKIVCQTYNTYGQSNEVHDEQGFVRGSLTCVFADPADGYEAPPVVRPTDQFMSIKTSNSTYARYGDMGLWEIKAAFVPEGTSDAMRAHAKGGH